MDDREERHTHWKCLEQREYECDNERESYRERNGSENIRKRREWVKKKLKERKRAREIQRGGGWKK